MKQLITRIDDDLHRRVKERAAAEGRSVNALVTEILRGALDVGDPRRALRARLQAEGRLASPAVGAPPPPRDEVIRSARGAGRSVNEALDGERRLR